MYCVASSNVRPLCYDYSADTKEKNMDFCECRYKL